jgi:integrase
MARTKRSTDLDTRNKRLALPLGKRCMETLAEGCYLLYKRPRNGSSGKWIARRYDKATRAFRQEALGTADDLLDADGLTVFAFDQAQKMAQALFEAWARESVLAAGGDVPLRGPYTVADAWSDYISDATARNVKGVKIMQQTFEVHIRPALGDVEVEKLTLQRVRAWHLALAQQGRILTGRARRPGEDLVRADLPTDEDGLRARKDTANRILTNLKAALNFAAQAHGVGRGTDWRLVKPFRGTTKARVRFLSVQEQQRLVNAAAPEFRALVQGALFTGARYGELTRVMVKDFNPDAGTVFIEFGKAHQGGYRPRHVILTPEAWEWFRSFTAGRPGNELLFQRGKVNRRGRAEALEGFGGWAPYDEVHQMELACKAGGVEPLTFYELRHTYASGLVNRGVELAFVAKQLGHANTRMVEKHYGHLCPSALAESIRKKAPVLGIGTGANVQALEINHA